MACSLKDKVPPAALHANIFYCNGLHSLKGRRSQLKDLVKPDSRGDIGMNSLSSFYICVLVLAGGSDTIGGVWRMVVCQPKHWQCAPLKPQLHPAVL